MKKTMLLLVVIALALLLSACGQSNTQTEDLAAAVDNGSGAAAGVPQGTLEPGSFPFEMPLQTLLLMGTFKLEDTNLAVQADQAKELLPLWQVLKGLLESDTAATEEINALVNQIAETMSDEQMQAINDMGLSMQDFFGLSQELGLDQGFPQAGDFQPGQRNGGTDQSFEGPPGGMPQGLPEGMPQGAGPGGGFGGGPGFAQGLSQEELNSLRATREAGGGGFQGMGLRGGGRMNIPMIEAVIELLQSK